jgi:hypothetical protein
MSKPLGARQRLGGASDPVFTVRSPGFRGLKNARFRRFSSPNPSAVPRCSTPWEVQPVLMQFQEVTGEASLRRSGTRVAMTISRP